VFPQQKDLLFIYRANPESIFLAPYQVSILNLFALLKLNQLNMDLTSADYAIQSLIKANAQDIEHEEEIRQLIPHDLGSTKCVKKFNELSFLASDSASLWELIAKISLVNAKGERAKLVTDAHRVREAMHRDQCYPLNIILENKFEMHRPALRLIKRHCIEEDICWDIKRVCDFSIYKKTQSQS